MNFRTEIDLEQSKNLIDYNSKIVLLGSCFSENIGQKLNYFKFQNFINPLGIFFQPLAIENLISRAINQNLFSERDVYFHNEQWLSLEAHSSCNKTEKDALITFLNQQLGETKKQLESATHLIITLGTAWTYFWKETNQPVANCHKILQKQFDKKLLTPSKITTSLNNIINLIQTVNPTVAIVFTVSPVRHIKDGIVENTRSKSHLLTAVHQVVEENRDCSYFPAYEIVNDDLRDYRFFEKDLVHPNEMAIDYIWEQFKMAYINSNTETVLKQVETVQRGLSHRTFNPESKGHQQFLANLEQKKNALKSNYNITF